MGREIKGLIIGALISGGIHFAVFFVPFSSAPTLHIQEIPGSIEISLGSLQKPLEKQASKSVVETAIPQQKIETTRVNPSPQAEVRIDDTVVDDDTSGEGKPNSRGNSTMAIPQEGNPKPPYPEIAWRRGYEGTVRLKVEVLATGKVGSIWVKESSGYKILDDSALKTLKEEWRLPEHAGSTVIIPVTFKLKDRLK